MTIKEFVEANEGKHVKIGFAQGFIYCDKVSRDRTLKEIEDASDTYIRQAHEMIDSLKKDIERLSDDDWANKKRDQFQKKADTLKQRISNFEEKRDNKKSKLRGLFESTKELFKRKHELHNVDISTLDERQRAKRDAAMRGTCRKISENMRKIRNLRNMDFDESIKRNKKLFKNECNEVKFNEEIEREAKNKIRLINQKKDQINTLRRSIRDFIPYLEVESSEIYKSEDLTTVIFISKQNDYITGKYWDEQEYHDRFLEKKKKYDKGEERVDIESVDALLGLFASEYGKLMLGKIHPEFIIEQMLNAEIYLVY